MSYKFGLVVEYRFGHSTCSSGPFVSKIGPKDAYLRGVSCDGSNRSGPVRFHVVLLLREAQTETGSLTFSGSGPVRVQFFPVHRTGPSNTNQTSKTSSGWGGRASQVP